MTSKTYCCSLRSLSEYYSIMGLHKTVNTQINRNASLPELMPNLGKEEILNQYVFSRAYDVPTLSLYTYLLLCQKIFEKTKRKYENIKYDIYTLVMSESQ